MNKKILCFFLFFFFVALIMGCIGNGGRETDDETIQDGLSTQILINGVQTKRVSLVSGQSAELGLNIKNMGENPVENVNVKLVGWLGEQSESETAEEIIPGMEYFLRWSIRSPELSRGERINHRAFIRMCFDYTTESYSDIVVIPEDYGAPPVPQSRTSSDYLNVLYNIGATRAIRDRENKIVGQVIIRNKGSGWIDYPTYEGNLQRDLLKEIKIEIEGLEGAEITGYGGVSRDFLQRIRLDSEELEGDYNFGVTDTIIFQDMLPVINGGGGVGEGVGRIDYETIVINYEDLEPAELYLLRVIRGQELTSRIEITLPGLDLYQDSVMIGRMHVSIEHGYCMDIATLDVTLTG